MRLRLIAAMLSLPLTLLSQGRDALSDYVAKAASAMKAGDYAAAESHYKALVKLRPDMPEAVVNLGLSCYLQKKYSEASGYFETALKKNEELTNARLLLGLTRFHLNRPAEAAAELERYVTSRSDDFQGVYFLGLSYLALDRFDDAERSLTKARQMQPRNTDVLYHLAQVHLSRARATPESTKLLSGQYEAIVNDLAALDPGSVRLAQLRAGFYEATGRKADAIKELETAASARPKVRGLHYTLGCLYLEALQYDSAIQQFQYELELDSPFPRTYLQLAHAYLKSGRPDQALQHLDAAAELEPRDTGLVWLEVARAQRALNRFDDAITAYRKAIAAGQRDASVYYQLSIAAKRAGKDELARQALATSEKLRKSAK